MYIVIIHQMNMIMHDPIIETILVVWLVLEYHLRVIIAYTLVQQKNLTWQSDWFGLKNDRIGNQYWLGKIKFRFKSRVWFKSGLQIKELKFIIMANQMNMTT